MVGAHLYGNTMKVSCGKWHLGDLRTPAVVSPKGDNVEVPASEATKHEDARKIRMAWRYVLKCCWWKNSCTTKDDDYPIVYRVLTISGGAGFLPSTVALRKEQNRDRYHDIMAYIVLGTLHTLRPCRSFRQIRVRWRIRKSALAFLKKLAVWTLQCLREVLSLMAENPHDGSWASWKTILLEMMEQTTVLPISAINSMNYLQLIIMHEVWLQYLDTLYPDFLPCHYYCICYYHTASFVIAWIADNVIVSWKYPLKSTYGTFFYMLPPVKCEGVYSSDRSLSDVPVPPSVTEGKLNQQAKQRWRLRRLADLWYLHIFTESTLAKKTRAFSLFFFCCVLTTV